MASRQIHTYTAHAVHVRQSVSRAHKVGALTLATRCHPACPRHSESVAAILHSHSRTTSCDTSVRSKRLSRLSKLTSCACSPTQCIRLHPIGSLCREHRVQRHCNALSSICSTDTPWMLSSSRSLLVACHWALVPPWWQYASVPVSGPSRCLVVTLRSLTNPLLQALTPFLQESTMPAFQRRDPKYRR